RVPPQHSHDHHPGGGDTHFHHRHVHHSLRPRLFHQHPHHARVGARHRRGGGRRHRRPRKHLPPCPGRPGPHAPPCQGHGRNRFRHSRHHLLACCRVHAAGLPHRPDRPPVHRIRRGRRRLRRHFGVRRTDAYAHDVRPHPQAHRANQTRQPVQFL